MNNDKNQPIFPSPKNDWDEDKLDEIFENINKEYKIYDSHNPKL